MFCPTELVSHSTLVCFNCITIPPIILGVLHIIIQNKLIHAVTRSNILPGNVIGLENSNFFILCLYTWYFTMIEFVDSFDYYDYVILRHIVIQGQPQQAVIISSVTDMFRCVRTSRFLRGRMEWHVMNYCLYTCA